MNVWSKSELQQVMEKRDTERLHILHNQIKCSSWRENYHIQPVTGLMNDPNGFSYCNGKWHLFYQWFPFGAVHGNKHWYHVESDDLVHWKNAGLGMRPDITYDNQGCYSGSAFVKGDIVYLVYTGNHNEPDGRRIPYQMIAAIDKDDHIYKLKEPIIKPQQGYTEHQRDPKIFYQNGYYYILLGAQDMSLHGKFLVYRSKQIADGWSFLGELKIEGYDHFGYMVECPDIERIGDQWLLLFSPQGLHEEREGFENAYQNVYMIGDLDLDTLHFTPKGPYQELDRGLDFYAAQCANQRRYIDKEILVGWFGVSDYTYPPTDDEGWANLLTLPRELTIENGKLKQRPSAELESLKGDILFEAVNGKVSRDRMLGRTPVSSIMSLENPLNENVKLNLFVREMKNGFEIAYDKETGVFSIDRGDMINQVNTAYGASRKITLENGLKSLKVFVDRSSVEVFVNDGEYVLSSRVFPTNIEHLLRMSGKGINLTIWNVNKAINDDFVLFPEWMKKEKK